MITPAVDPALAVDLTGLSQSDDEMSLSTWGLTMRQARRASFLACEEMRRIGVIKDPAESAIILYTDDPSAAMYLMHPDAAVICNTSEIAAVCIIGGKDFPPASHEAERGDRELPRIAAMFVKAQGSKCPRCRRYTVPVADELCFRCAEVIQSIAI